MSFDLAFWVAVTFNVTTLAALRGVRRLRHSGRFHAACLFAELACVGLMAHTAFGRAGEFKLEPGGIRDAIGVLGMWILWGATLLPFFVFLVWEYADEVRRWFIGEKGRARRSYDQVEAALLMRDRDRAERLVRDMIAAEPQEAELHLVLGDVLLRKGDRAGASAAFRESLALARDAEERAGLRLRIADHLGERGDPGEAAEHLERVLDELPRTRLAEAALARLRRLRSAGNR